MAFGYFRDTRTMHLLRSCFLACTLIACALSTSALPLHAQTRAPAPAGAAAPDVRVPPAAVEPVRVVGDFMTALSKGNLRAAREFLEPGVVVITDGVIRGDRDAYMAQQASADAAFLRRAQRQLLRRDARAGPGMAWVVSEKLFKLPGGDPKSATAMSETIVLVKTPAGWKIAHIHWSSRPLVAR
jgi:hypothetical protein